MRKEKERRKRRQMKKRKEIKNLKTEKNSPFVALGSFTTYTSMINAKICCKLKDFW